MKCNVQLGNAAQFVDWFDGDSLDQVEAVLRFIATETDIENGARKYEINT
jgi:hypothetical protein